MTATATQLPLPDAPRFDGSDYLPWRDDVRLTGQLKRIWSVVCDEQWHTLSEIAARTGDHEPSISAQLRHLRKPRFGQHTVEREHVGNGLFRYRVLINRERPVRPSKEEGPQQPAPEQRARGRELIEGS